jgi:hypothetical protein
MIINSSYEKKKLIKKGVDKEYGSTNGLFGKNI